MSQKIKKTIKGEPATILDVKPVIMEDTYILDYKGEKQLKSACCSIKGLYYKLGDPTVKNSGDVYEINGTKYRITTGKIVWSEISKKYVLLQDCRNNFVDSILIFTNDELLEENTITNITGQGLFVYPILISGKRFHVLSNFNNKNYIYDFTQGVFRDRQEVISTGKNTKSSLLKKATYESLPSEIYSLSEYPLDPVRTVFKKVSNLYKTNKRDNLLKYNYGFEVETDYGFLPESIYYLTGTVPLKDGSIRGTEITSLIINNKVTDYVNKAFTEIAKFTKCSFNNSLHLNISGFNNDIKTRVALFYLYSRLENEIETFVPWYKRNLEYLTGKAGGPKDHCKTLPIKFMNVKPYFQNPNVNYDAWLENFDKQIFRFLNNNNEESVRHNRKNRRHVAEGAPKWEHHGRYYSLNLEPLYFGDIAGSRVEFRVHSGTVNPLKTIMWTHICTAIVKYAEDKPDYILKEKVKITLFDVLSHYCGEDEELLEMINLYIETRTYENQIAFNEKDTVSNREFDGDENYDIKFNRKSMTSMIFE